MSSKGKNGMGRIRDRRMMMRQVVVVGERLYSDDGNE